MPISQQKVKKLSVKKLKGLQNCEIEIGDGLTAVMGTNCSGKTTVLHALACTYRPPQLADTEYKFPMFFRPSTDSPWSGSEFTTHYSEREDTDNRPDEKQTYEKTEDRWTPRYSRRPERHVKYLMLRDCVPEIELVTQQSFVTYTKNELNDAHSNAVREAVGKVLNRHYDGMHEVEYRRGTRRSVGVMTENMSYSALAMSAGEQRVFRIFDTVFSVPDYGLVLIDEIDLFLHQDALQRLLDKLVSHCSQKNIQLVFTTHFPPIAQMYDRVQIVSLHRSIGQTLVWRGYSFEALAYITGEPQRPITIHVEDDVAQAIIGKIAADQGIRKRVETSRYGPAINAFTLGAGMILKGDDLDNQLIVLDGDVYATRAAKQSQISRVLTGNQAGHDEKRESVRKLVRRLYPTGDMSPEQMLHAAVISIDLDGLAAEDAELVNVVKAVVNPPDKHKFVDNVVDQLGSPRAVVINQMVRLAAETPGWDRYTRVVRIWIEKRKEKLGCT